MGATVPRLSIVIPTLDRPAVLRRALDQLERQTTGPEAFEVIVVRDLADSDEAAVADAVGERPYAVRLLTAPSAGVCFARNAGWRDARAPLVMFLGDDILASPGLLAEHLAWHERHPEPEVGVLGRIEWARELRVTPFMRWLEEGIQFDFKRIQGTDAGWGRFYTSNVSVKRAMLEQVDGFDEDFVFLYEDLDLARRMSEHGFRLLYARDALAEHLHEVTIESYARRMALIGRSERMFSEKHPDFEPYFKPMFDEVATWPPKRGRLAPLASVVPERVPVIGRLAWTSARVQFLQRLAPGFLAAWDAVDEPSPAGR